MHRTLTFMTIVVGLGLGVGCGGSASYAMGPQAAQAPMEAHPGVVGTEEVAASAGTATGGGHSPQASTATVVAPDATVQQVERPSSSPRLIYVANLTVAVDQGQVVAALDRILQTTLNAGGYLSSRSDTAMTVRVPSGRFHESMALFEQTGDVTGRSVNVQDVSEEFHDLEIRIESLAALHARMQNLLEQASTLDEILRIERELERLARDIDQARGRLRFLSTQVAWSTVALAIRERPAAPPPSVTPPAPPPPAPQVIDLPIEWLGEASLDNLLTLH